jgi:hypothetical protein
MTKRTLGILAGMALAAMTGLARNPARAANDNGEQAAPPHPPQEAIDACANQNEGATCTISFHGKSLQGTCVKGPDGQETLACMPPPPPEAVEACASLSDGATCTVSHHGRTVEGKCRLSPSGAAPLVCVPPPPSHR